MSATIEQEEDYRVKNARLGLALYIPSKPMEETIAMKKTTITVSFPLDQAQKLKKVTGEVPYLLGNAASIFRMLFKMTAGGFTPEEGELCSLYELCGRGLDSARDREGSDIDTFDMELGNALKAYPEEVVS